MGCKPLEIRLSKGRGGGGRGASCALDHGHGWGRYAVDSVFAIFPPGMLHTIGIFSSDVPESLRKPALSNAGGPAQRHLVDLPGC